MTSIKITEEQLDKLKRDQDYAKIISKQVNSLELEEAKGVFEKLASFAKQSNLIKAYSWFNYYLAWVYYDMLELEKAVELHQEGLQTFKEMKFVQGELISINGLFACYDNLQMFDDAIELGIEGIELAKSCNNFEMVGIIKSNMLATYVEIEEYEKGIELYEEITKSNYIYDTDNEIVGLINRGLCDIKRNRPEEAKKYIDEAYDIAEKSSSRLMPTVLAEMANIYIGLESYNLAEEKLREAYTYIKKGSISEISMDLYEVHGDLELKRNNYKLALEKYELLYKKYSEKKWRKKIKDICKKLSQVYMGLEDYKRANSYLEKYMEVDEEIRRMRSNDKLKVFNNKREEEEKRAYKTLYNQTESLYEFGQMITSNLQKEDILDTVAKEIKKVINYDIVQIIVYNEEKRILEYQLFLQDDNVVKREPISIEKESFAGYCIKNRKEIIINDIHDEFYRYLNWEKYVSETLENEDKKYDCNSAIFVPIILNNKGTGVISIQSYQKNQYDVKDISTMKIMCSFLGIALENARLYNRVRYLAIYDDLTKIFNKREVMKRGQELYQKVTKSSKRAVIMIDIDDFKRINDRYGHVIGDQVIHKVALTMKEHLNKDDIIGRYGGEEFIVFLPYGRVKKCKEMAELLRESVQDIELISKDEKVKVTISVGVAIARSDTVSLYQLVDYADNELYKAKRAGKNRVKLHNYEKEES